MMEEFQSLGVTGGTEGPASEDGKCSELDSKQITARRPESARGSKGSRVTEI